MSDRFRLNVLLAVLLVLAVESQGGAGERSRVDSTD
jgi:hypothetical protein